MSGKFKKMSLIPHEMVEKLMYQQRHKEDTRPQVHYATNLDKEMQEILTRDNLTEYDKAMLYMQLLNKYLGTIHSRDIPKIQEKRVHQMIRDGRKWIVCGRRSWLHCKHHPNKLRGCSHNNRTGENLTLQ